MLSRLLALLILVAVGVYFLVSSEDGVAVSLFDWLKDPADSRREHATWVAGERERARDGLALDDAGRGLTMIDDVGPGDEATYGVNPLAADDEAVAKALAGAEDEDDLEALRVAGRVPLRGVVVGPDGSPLEGVTVGASQPGGHEARAESDSRGAFELRLHGAAGSLAYDATHWVGLGGELALAPGLNVGRDVRVLVAAPRADLAGRTLAADGAALAGVRVSVAHTYADVPEALRALVPERFELEARSDAEGRWELAPLPDLPGLRVRFEAEGRAAVERTAEELRALADVTLSAG